MKTIDFLDKNTFLVLESLLNKNYYLRELAEETNLAPSSVHKITTRLIKKNIILTKTQKNRKILKLNYNSPLARKAISIIFVDKLMNCRAFTKLTKLKLRGVYLFGSANRGTVTTNSDIDLAVFFEEKPDLIELSTVKRELSKEIRRDVQLVTLTNEKIKSMKKENIELLNQIKYKSTTLWGEELE